MRSDELVDSITVAVPSQTEAPLFEAIRSKLKQIEHTTVEFTKLYNKNNPKTVSWV
jgi:hypothetical protein